MVLRWVILVALSIVGSGWAQNPCGDNALVYPLRWPERHPPVSIYMPYDVLVGYIALDSVINWATTSERQYQVRSLLWRRHSMDDTLKKIVRSMYAMTDYDPMLYEATLWDFRFPQLPPFLLREEVLSAVKEAWGDDSASYRRDLALLRAHYIAHVKVDDTVHIHIPRNVNGGIGRLVVATCRVLDLIKGQVTPPCNAAYTHHAPVVATTPKLLRPLTTERCLQFTYVPEQPLSGYYCIPFLGERFGDTIVPGRQYMVFLSYARLCKGQDSTGDYWELLPVVIDLPEIDDGQFRLSVGAYEIVSRDQTPMVSIPRDEYGWGTEVPLTTFKQRLRARIEEIRNW